MIKQRTMGRTSLSISELCLGTLNFGWNTDETNAFAILDAFYAAGGNFIQTSGDTPGLALPSAMTSISEELVGRWWRSRGIARDNLVLATRIRVGAPEERRDSLTRFVREKCQQSLRRLQTTYLDLVIFEWNDGLLPIRNTLEAFDAIVRGGYVRFVGAANFPVWRVADTIGRAYLRNHSRMETLQADYSLMTRARFEPEAMSLCQEQRLGFLARSPLAGGFLARRNVIDERGNATRRQRLAQRFGNAYGDAGLAAVSNVAARYEASSAQVALSWVLHNRAVTSAVVGVQSPAQLSELIGAGQINLTAIDLAQLNDATAAEEVLVTFDSSPREAEPFELVRN